MPRWCTLASWILVCLGAACLHAQAPASDGNAAAAEDVHVPVLRVSVNLVQIPVLVLEKDRTRALPVEVHRFRASIDSGPWFAPTHVRREGDDALRCVIFLDRSQRTERALADLPANLGQLFPVSLHGSDEVSLVSLSGPTVTRTKPFAAGAQMLFAASEAVMPAQPASGKVVDPALLVPAGPRLWDALAVTLARFDGSTARNVLLLLTDGADHGSGTDWKTLGLMAVDRDVTIFAIAFRTPKEIRRLHNILRQDAFSLRQTPGKDAGDPLEALTGMTGGLLLEGDGHPVAESVARVLRMVRERYIVDFPAPSGMGTGRHDLRVALDQRSHLLMRPAGVSYLNEEADHTADPNHVPTDPTREPPFGKRRPLTGDRQH